MLFSGGGAIRRRDFVYCRIRARLDAGVQERSAIETQLASEHERLEGLTAEKGLAEERLVRMGGLDETKHLEEPETIGLLGDALEQPRRLIGDLRRIGDQLVERIDVAFDLRSLDVRSRNLHHRFLTARAGGRGAPASA